MTPLIDAAQAAANAAGRAALQQGIYKELTAERRRQIEKWGEQEQAHPDGTGPDEPIGGRMLLYSRDLARVARDECDRAARDGRLTWRHILDEEVHEAFAEADPVTLRMELVQAAAVIVGWIEDIDRRPRR